MKKIVNILSFFLILIATISCNQKEEKVVYSDPVFPVDKEVELEMILVDPLMPNVISDIDYYNGKLILTYRLNDRHIHFFDAESGEELGSSINIGQGPGEMIYLNKFSLDRKTGTFTAYDWMAYQLYSGNIDSLFNGASPSPVNEDFGSAYSVFPLPQGYFYYQPPYNADKERRFFLKTHNGEIATYEGYPYDDFKLLINICVSYRNGFFKDGTKMVAASYPGLMLEFFDLRNGIEKTHTRYYWKIFLGNDGSPDTESSGGMFDFYCTDNFIYATLVEPNNGLRANNIVIFDWEGNPVKIFRTKYKKLFNLCIDDEERLLYVVGEDNDGIRFLAKLDLTKH